MSGSVSAPARPGRNSTGFSALNPQFFRLRAVENDYSDKVPLSRSSSVPFTQAGFRQQRDRLRTGGERCDSTGQSFERKRLVFPGTAHRVPPRAATFPSVAKPPVQRELKPLKYNKHRFEKNDVNGTQITSTRSSPLIPPPPSTVTPPAACPLSETAAKQLNFLSDKNRNFDERKHCRNQARIERTFCPGGPPRELLLAELDKKKEKVTSRCEHEKENDLKKSLILKPDRASHTRQPTTADHAVIEFDDVKCKPGQHNYRCPRCDRCMCRYCKGQEKRPRSRTLWCGGRCECTADAIVDTATCFCLVRACFYHCSNSEEAQPVRPCSCGGPDCCPRWATIAALSLFLPCLLCYPLAKGCVLACKQCSRCSSPGCRCKESNR